MDERARLDTEAGFKDSFCYMDGVFNAEGDPVEMPARTSWDMAVQLAKQEIHDGVAWRCRALAYELLGGAMSGHKGICKGVLFHMRFLVLETRSRFKFWGNFSKHWV